MKYHYYHTTLADGADVRAKYRNTASLIRQARRLGFLPELYFLKYSRYRQNCIFKTRKKFGYKAKRLLSVKYRKKAHFRCADCGLRFSKYEQKDIPRDALGRFLCDIDCARNSTLPKYVYDPDDKDPDWSDWCKQVNQEWLANHRKKPLVHRYKSQKLDFCLIDKLNEP